MACPVCGSTDTDLFMHGVFDSDTTDVIECASCGLQFLSPLMTEQEEDDFYNGYYRKQQSRGFKEMRLSDQQDRAFLHYEQYRNVYLGLIAGCKSILEVGCGSGGFLRFASEHVPNLNITATERCVENIRFIKDKFPDIRVSSELSKFRGEFFDSIFVLAVFEHLRDSLGFLREIKGFLKPGGTLVLRLPNKNHPLAFAFDLAEFRKFMYIKQHYYTFTEQSLAILAKNSGYSIIDYIYLQVWGLDNHLSWLRYRKPRDFSSITALLSKETLGSYNQDLIEKKITDSYIAVFKAN